MAVTLKDGETAAQPRPRRPRPRLGYRIFDVDVHHSYCSNAVLLPYLPERYRERYRTAGIGDSMAVFDYGGDGVNRRDCTAPDGSPPGSNPRYVAEHLLNRYDMEYAVCTGAGILGVGTIPDADYAAALARAHNDWTINEWLPHDPRYLAAIVVAQQDPEQAAAEIDRVGDHPRVVMVVMSSGNPAPLGQRRYHPIYAAAERHGLPVAIHPGTEGRGITTPCTSAGYPSRYVEWHTNLALNYMAHLASMVAEGVFVKFPGFKFLMLEGGISWLPPLMWRMDRAWKELRSETPYLTELPSTYIKRHVRFSTQPVEEPDDPRLLLEAYELVDAEHTVLYSSDYPHWDFDDPYTAFPRLLPERLRRRILRENARELFAAKLATLEAGSAGAAVQGPAARPAASPAAAGPDGVDESPE